MEHLGTKKMETERLLLRQLTIEDTENVFKNWTNDDEVTKYLTWPAHKDINVTINVLENWIKNYESMDFYQWGIVLKEINEPIGTISVVDHSDGIKMVCIGYCIGLKWWNKGITTEALDTVIKFFFEEVGVNRVEAKFVVGNESSGKVMIKCGMKYEGLKRQEHLCNQGILDTKHYAILSEDYRK
jgi:ribosomal-protein-alanine N-acetyltransferase